MFMIFSNLFSAIIGGIFVLFGTILHYWMEKRAQEKVRKKLIGNFLSGIQKELSILWNIYSQCAGDQLEKLGEDQPFSYYYFADHSYFTIYENNASLIVEIENEEIKDDILSVYNMAKSLLDSYKMNNYLNNEYKNSELNFMATKNDKFKTRVLSLEDELKKYAKHLKKSHSDFKSRIKILIGKIDKMQ